MLVDVGVAVPEATAPDKALPDAAGLARLAERAGLDCLWSGDRLVAGHMSVLDSTLTLAAAAAVTHHIAIEFSVYVPSLRPAGLGREADRQPGAHRRLWPSAARRGPGWRRRGGVPSRGFPPRATSPAHR
jgi:hypothetical protein